MYQDVARILPMPAATSVCERVSVGLRYGGGFADNKDGTAQRDGCQGVWERMVGCWDSGCGECGGGNRDGTERTPSNPGETTMFPDTRRLVHLTLDRLLSKNRAQNRKKLTGKKLPQG